MKKAKKLEVIETPKKTKDTETIKQPVIPELVSGEIYVEVEQTVLSKKLIEKPKVIKVRPFITTPAHISVHAKRHIPLGPDVGNLTVAITISCPAYNEELLEVYKQVSNIVDKLMDAKITKIMSEISNG